MIPADVPRVLQWLEGQHRTATAECGRLLERHRASAGAGRTADDVIASMTLTADVAAATARLEVWNELRAELVAVLITGGCDD